MIMALIYRNVPRKRANELLLLGERWSAQEALAAGIVNKVVPDGGSTPPSPSGPRSSPPSRR